MKKWVCFALVVMLLCAGSAALAEKSNRSLLSFEPAIKELAAEHGFRLGICLSAPQLENQNYLEFLSSQFSTTTCTNETKAYSLLDQKACQNSTDGMPRMNYDTADRMLHARVVFS